jgi:hypothetical protein
MLAPRVAAHRVLQLDATRDTPHIAEMGVYEPVRVDAR